jgi:flagellar biosynthesis protein FlhB
MDNDATSRQRKQDRRTSKKKIDKFEKGNIPVSREASAFAAILALLAITAFMARDFLKSVGCTLTRLSSDPGGLQLQNGADAASLFEARVWEIGASIVPVLAAGLASSFLQHGPRIVLTGSSGIGLVYH